jgi:hypothetical protein
MMVVQSRSALAKLAVSMRREQAHRTLPRSWILSLAIVSCGSSAGRDPACPASSFAADASPAQLECGGETNPAAIGKTCEYPSAITCHCAAGFEPNSWRWTCVRRSGENLCPLTQPRDQWGCRADNFGYGGFDYTGSRCTYGSVTCECKNIGQNSSLWTCMGAVGDAGS